MMNRLLYTASLTTCLLLAAFSVRAQPQPQPRGINFSVSLAPTMNWLQDVQVRLGELQGPPGEQLPDGFQEQADSLLAVFNQGEFPARIGFEAGLSMTASRGWMGLRAGVHLLNTGGVFNGVEYFDEEQLRENFVTVLLGLQLQKATGPALFYVFGGPELRYHLDLTGEDNITTSAVRDNLESLSTAATVGAGVKIRMMGIALTPEVRYAFGLSGVSDRTFEADGIPFQLGEDHTLNNLAFGLVFGL